MKSGIDLRRFGLLIFIVSFMLVACGRNADSDIDRDNPHARYFNDRSLFYGETITISVAGFVPGGRWINLEAVAQTYMAQNPGATIIIERPTAGLGGLEVWTTFQEYLHMRLLTGNAPTMFTTNHGVLDWMDPRVNRLLADWMPIMQQEPSFREDDFFMNAFGGISQNAQGRLVVYPAVFVNTFHTFNTTIPGLYGEIAGRNALSALDILEIYESLNLDGFYTQFSPFSMVSASLSNFLDLETERIDFYTPEFIDLLTRAREAMGPNPDIRMLGGLTNTTPAQEYEFSHSILFHRVSNLAFQYMVEFEEPLLFANPIPLTNDAGEILMIPNTSFGLNAAASYAQQALAWDFLLFMQRYGIGAMGNGTPVYRPNLPSYILPHRNATMGQHWIPNGWRPVGDDLAQIEYFLTKISDMPMTIMWGNATLRNAIETILYEVLSDFQDGLTNPRQAAEYLQNRITIVLMEMD